MNKIKKTYTITAKANGVMFPEEFYVQKTLSDAKKMFSIMKTLYPYQGRKIEVTEHTINEDTNERSAKIILSTEDDKNK